MTTDRRSIRSRTTTFGRLFLIVAGTLLVLLAGCTNDSQDAQPNPAGSDFVSGGFDDLPRYPDSEPIGTRSEDGDVVTQSFKVTGASQEMIVSFYEEELTDWEATGPEQAGEALRAEFLAEDGTLLELSAVVLSQGGIDVTQTIQYSLVLRQ